MKARIAGFCLAAALAAVALALSPASALATFHLMKIREVYPGSSTSPEAEYVELQMYAAGQNLVAGHSLDFLDAAGAQVGTASFSADVANSANQSTLVAATPAAESQFGIAADTGMPGGSLDPGGGAVCWESLDCVSWGSFHGSALSPAGSPADPLGIPDGMAPGAMDTMLDYAPIEGERHRHGATVHSHPHTGPHTHEKRPHSHEGRRHSHEHGHGHSHGLVDESIKRSREGLRAVAISLAVLALGALAQLLIYLASGSVALLADLIHNFGDASTAIPLAIAFLLRSERAERIAGLFVVAAIFVSACVAGVEAVSRLIHPQAPTHLVALALAGLIGFGANWIAAIVRSRAGRRLDSPALLADGNHARADSYVSLAVVASAVVVAIGVPIADPLIGLAITAVILKITWDSWRTVSGHGHSHEH